MFSLMQNQLSVHMIKGTLAFAHSSSSSSLDEKSKKKKTSIFTGGWQLQGIIVLFQIYNF